MSGLAELADEPFCYVTTGGRVAGRAHTIGIWLGVDGSTLYMLSGGKRRSDWVKNLIAEPVVNVRIGLHEFEGEARIVDDGLENSQARQLLLEKYGPTYAGDLSAWGKTALPVAVDLMVV